MLQGKGSNQQRKKEEKNPGGGNGDVRSRLFANKKPDLIRKETDHVENKACLILRRKPSKKERKDITKNSPAYAKYTTNPENNVRRIASIACFPYILRVLMLIGEGTKKKKKPTLTTAGSEENGCNGYSSGFARKVGQGGAQKESVLIFVERGSDKPRRDGPVMAVQATSPEG